MPKFYITYQLGSPLQDNYSLVEAEDTQDALLLVEQAGVRSAAAYPETFEKNISRYGLKPITLAQARKVLPL